jgi:hypothetical protein
MARSILLALGVALPLAATATEPPFSKAELFFELNHTDGDLGIHALIDGDEWRRLEIEDPDGRRLLDIYVSGRLRRQGLTEIAFESAEPQFAELPPEQFFARFPEGRYEISGTMLDGQELESVATISHVMPAPVSGIRVDGREIPSTSSCDRGPLPTVPEDVSLQIVWDEVSTSHPDLGSSGAVTIESYEVILERPGFKMATVVAGDETDLEVGDDVLESGERIKLEILARATNGNRTAVETCFDVE